MQLVVTLAIIAIATCVSDAAKSDNTVISIENESCDTVFCSMGKECVMEKKKPICACIEKCQGRGTPVCGSIGSQLYTYKSECHLYKEACERENVTITLVADKSCDSVKMEEQKASKTIERDEKKAKPVVCREKDRDGVRKAIIKWISGKLNSKVDSVSYKGILLKYFFSLDLDNDKKIDTMEFMKLLEEDDSITEILGASRKNRIAKGLCSTELIATTDKDSDYKLGFEEFHQCLDPEFEPPNEKCELVGVQYDDGEDVPAECGNICKCACGHWVCTQKECPQGSKEGNRAEDIIGN